MKIKGTCQRDGRELLMGQVVDSGGVCPWDGEPFSEEYAVTLVNALRDADEFGTKLEAALEQIAALDPDFTIQPASVLGSLKSSIDRLTRAPVLQG